MSRLAAVLIANLVSSLILAGPAMTQARAQSPAPAANPPAPPSVSAQGPSTAERPKDIFAEPVTLTEKTVVYVKGQANWGTAFETLVAKFRQINAYLDKQKIAPTGPAMTIYTQTDDTGFSFQAALPIASEPKTPPDGDILVGRTPSGKMLKFVHRGAFDTLDSTYEAITNYLDEKNLEARDLFIEEYASDPVKASEDNLVVNIYVPLK